MPEMKSVTHDILNCLANLSNDEVFTPPELANKMIDLLPGELFDSTETTFLDPCCKSGVFLREIAKRLIDSKSHKNAFEKTLSDNLSEEEKHQKRLDHIYHKQLFGIAITQLTALMTRRTLYCSKYPNTDYSVSKFDDIAGNIRFERIDHTWDKNGKCKYCGASKSNYSQEARGENRETHAYEFIETDKPEELWGNMKFDVIIGNPPYQMSDGGAQASASPLYNEFVETAKKLHANYNIMIIPARWYTGGKGLNEFRNSMMDDICIKELHDFPNTAECFPNVNIRGGVCYFLRDQNYNNLKDGVKVVTHLDNDRTKSSMRKLRYDDLEIFLRYSDSISILNKIKLKSKNKYLIKYVSPRKPFGLSTDFVKSNGFHLNVDGLQNPIACYGKNKVLGYVERNEITSHENWINVWKVFTPRANNIGTELNDDNLNTFIGKNEICTESYLVIGAELNLTKNEAQNLSNYLQTKFVRFCHALSKCSQDATSKTYQFVPLQDFSKPWTDAELYEKYGLSQEEIDFIESMIKPME